VLGDMSTISRRAREREIRQRILHDRITRAVVSRLPAALPAFAEMLLGALIVFLILAALLSYFADVKPLYTLSALGLVYSLQLTYYKIRLSADPTYMLPKCRCPGRASDKTEIVLRSRESAILGTPNSVLSALLYAAVFAFVYSGHEGAAVPLGILAAIGSLYLSYVMIVRLASLCPTCVNVAAVNALIVWQLVL
jgi:uncharacterized membrane protein